MKNKELKFNTLKKSHKKQVIIGSVFICIAGSILTFTKSRARYKVTESIPLVRGKVNYKVPDLRTVALYTANDSGTYVETNNIPTSGYQLNKTKSVCKVYDGSTSVENAPVDSSITIEYKNGKVNFLGITKRNTRCYLYFDKAITIPDIIAKSTKGNGTPTFSKTSCTSGCEETTVGTYTVSDGMYGGTSTYWRGDTTDNYAKFAGFCWRIVRINGDGSIRLIYDGTTCHANGEETTDSIALANQPYNSSYSQSNHVGWTYIGTSQRTLNGTNSNAKSQIENWYNTNLASYASKIADGKYCNDRDTRSGHNWSLQPTNTFSYAAQGRIQEFKTPTLLCPNEDTYVLKIGLITADEVAYAGGVWGKENNVYFLYDGQYYWTMTPLRWYYLDSTNCYSDILRIHSKGQLIHNYTNAATPGLRPVINLRSDITFSGGNGTQSSPYTVSN